MFVQPLEGALGASPLGSLAGIGEAPGALAQELSPESVGGDAISRLVPPWLTGAMGANPMQTALVGPLSGLMQQLIAMLQWMMGSGSASPSPYPGAGCPSSGGGAEQFFPSANGASAGDPHLSFNGNHWNSMVSHPDLLSSDSIPGGFRISTQVTPPNARGATWNQSASVTTNNGATTISMNNAGQPTIESYGQNIPIADGQTVQLGNGESVTRNGNGSLTITAQNGSGGQIVTTLTAQGQGVNVDVSAQNVDLGGALVDGAPGNGGAQPPTFPQPPIAGPPATFPQPPPGQIFPF